MADPERDGTEDAAALPCYLGGLDHHWPGPEPDENERHHLMPDAVQDGWAALGRVAHHLSDRLATATDAAPPPAGIETVRGVVIHITRHLVLAPGEAARAFDRCLPRLREPIVTRRGTLVLSTGSTARARRDPSQMLAVSGRLHLWLSPMALPVELDLVPWGGWRTMVTLHPERRFGWTVGAHRRSRWFAAGHAVMDVVIGHLRACEDHVDAQPPASISPPACACAVSSTTVAVEPSSYDAPSCGRSWSTPIRTRTA